MMSLQVLEDSIRSIHNLQGSARIVITMMFEFRSREDYMTWIKRESADDKTHSTILEAQKVNSNRYFMASYILQGTLAGVACWKHGDISVETLGGYPVRKDLCEEILRTSTGDRYNDEVVVVQFIQEFQTRTDFENWRQGQ